VADGLRREGELGDGGAGVTAGGGCGGGAGGLVGGIHFFLVLTPTSTEAEMSELQSATGNTFAKRTMVLKGYRVWFPTNQTRGSRVVFLIISSYTCN
jgi:hypothetical protein